MDPTFWHDRWRQGDIGFHQTAVSDLLARHWPALGLDAGARVFVPLCGKSLDMAWLAARGHTVVGSELSELALDAFLSGQGLTPAESFTGPFIVKRAAPYELWLGDHFALPPHAFRTIAAVYDRAALIAMPRTLQQAYADKLAELLTPGTPVLLTALEYDPSEMSGPPFSVPRDQVEQLFTKAFYVRLVDSREGPPVSDNLKKRGLTRLAETVYLLRRR